MTKGKIMNQIYLKDYKLMEKQQKLVMKLNANFLQVKNQVSQW